VPGIEDVLATFERTTPSPDDERRHFHGVYRRNTLAVKRALDGGAFLDPAWVDRWDAVFADLYFDALEASTDGRQPSAPWQLAFDAAADPGIPPLVKVLVSMNAHINFDLPQSLLALMNDEELADRDLVRRRQVDFERIDLVLVDRVKEEDLELRAVSDPADYTRFDRVLTPFNRAASKRFLKESRRKVWRNTHELAQARASGPEVSRSRLRELEELCRAKVADLLRPGRVLLRLGVTGFGVVLPPRPG
jgi:uncharacterized protein DUF5995